MRIELLVVADCPNEATTAQRLRQVLDETGHADTRIDGRVVTADNVAAVPAFGGSPTILLDGVDPFAEQAPGAAGLSCRVYRSARGLTGAPPLDELRRAVREHLG